MAYQILLVDDVLLNRKVVKVALSGLPDVTFLEAADGVNALKVIHSETINLAILDLIMPGEVAGFDVLREIKASVLYKHIPIIVYSAVSDTASIKQALELGAYDYLIKPLKPQELQTILPEKVKDALQFPSKKDEQQLAEKESYGQAVREPDQLVIGVVTEEEVAAIKYLTDRKAELKLKLKRLIDMDKEELYCTLYDMIIQEMGEVSTACEQWWDEKYDKYQWANIVGDEIELDYDNGQVLVKKMTKESKKHHDDDPEGKSAKI
ncbi:Chemotaxis protein CheY [Sporomusa ovata DSM 2662]|uniref:Two-component system response regulator (Hybrid family) n=1 Tax=Sporomusa ovata TaxID=2378 RepID=A0A0U1KZ48_9FIRM|nr:CXXX repeat peptide modification system protein [Sporomusa ovata]EQB27760.1 protein phosphatase 2C domain containing protein [Sporomusa ovata DSM 2662]CQR72688.1 two-component system response regulator (hybrid family) [Sporomusa ovata]